MTVSSSSGMFTTAWMRSVRAWKLWCGNFLERQPMKTTLERLTPAIARNWLAHNKNNRAIRASHVETLRAAFARGEFVTTHQGVAFDTGGDLLDGQHRLH